MPSRQRLTAFVSTFTTGSVIAGSVWLGGVPMAASSTGPLSGVHRHVELVDITTPLGTILVPWPNPTLYPTLEQMEKFILDGLLGIGPQTLPQFMDPDGTTPLQDLFDGWNGLVGTTFELGGPNPSNMNDVFDSMGLQNIDVTAVLTMLGMTPDETFADVLTRLGLDDVTLDDLLAGFNVNANTSLAALVDSWGMGTETVGTLLTQLGIDSGVTLDGMMTGLGLGQLEGFLPLMGLTPTMPAWSAIATLTGSTITSTTTFDELLGSGGLFETIGSMTLGQLLGFTDTTALSAVLGGLQFNLGGTMTPLGDFTVTELLGQIQLTPDESLADVLGSLPLGTGGAADLGTTTLADFLSVFAGGMPIDETTTITEFLEGANLATQSIDTLLNLDGVDISNWFIPA